MIIDEPTRGIDTKQQIYEFIRSLAADGKPVFMISSEMQEVIGLANRVIVMREGRIAGTVAGSDIAEEPMVRLDMGLNAQSDTNIKEPV